MFELGVVYRNIVRTDRQTADALGPLALRLFTKPWAESAACALYAPHSARRTDLWDGGYRFAAPRR